MASPTKVTMSDIAAKAGVSQSTVSLVLNNSRSIKLAESTRQRVFDVAQQLGYKRAQTVKHGQQIKKIALVVNDLTTNDPFIHAINAAQEAAWQHNLVVVTFDYNNDHELAAHLGEEIERGDYVGMIYASSMTRALSLLRVSAKVPTVMLNCFTKERSQYVSVLPADKLNAYKAVTHLLEQGNKRVAIIQGEEWMEASQQRFEGYRQALINQDISPESDLIRTGNWSMKEAFIQTLELLAASKRPDAIFCCSDYMALGCLQAIAQSGLQVPEDIAVAGYDNLLLAQEATPALTSMNLPYDEMGKLAVENLIDIVNGNSAVASQLKVEGELFVRESTLER